MNWILIIIVSHAVTHVQFSTKKACEEASTAIQKQAVEYGERFITVCAAESKL